MTPSVHVFWDNSNIFVPARFMASKRDGVYAEPLLRIHFGNLYRLAHAGRPVRSAVCIGSASTVAPALWNHVPPGVKVEIYERGRRTGTEQGVDQCLQVH